MAITTTMDMPTIPKKNGQPETRISRHSLTKSNNNHALSEYTNAEIATRPTAVTKTLDA